MNTIILRALRVVVFVFIILIGIYIYRLFKIHQLEKRVTKFSLKTMDQKQETVVEKVKSSYYRFIDNISKIFKKLGLFKILKKKYEDQYISNEKIKYPEYYIISSKIVISFLLVLLVIVLSIIKLKNINILVVILTFILGFFLPDIYSGVSKKKKEKELEKDLLKAVIIMNNAFKSGRSIMQAIELVSTELDSDMGKEFKKIFIDLTYGLELSSAFDRFYNRVKLDEIKYISSSLVLVNKTGGNIVEVFNSIENEFYERKKLHDELFYQTALSNLVFKILVAIPFIIFLVIYVINPSYFSPMYMTGIGRILSSVIIVIYISYILIVRKIVRLKVW